MISLRKISTFTTSTFFLTTLILALEFETYEEGAFETGPYESWPSTLWPKQDVPPDQDPIDELHMVKTTAQILTDIVNGKDGQIRIVKSLLLLRHEMDSWENEYYKMVLNGDWFNNTIGDGWKGLYRSTKWKILIGKPGNYMLRRIRKLLYSKGMQQEDIGSSFQRLYSTINEKLFTFTVMTPMDKDLDNNTFSDRDVEICKQQVEKLMTLQEKNKNSM